MDLDREILYAPAKLDGVYVSVGNFDGVHIGHRKIIGECAAEAKAHGKKTVMWAFDTPPSFEIPGVSPKKCLMTNSDKALAAFLAGADAVYFDRFSDVRDMPPEEFCEKIIKKRLGAEKVFCGYNFSFGKGGRGKAGDLERILSGMGIGCKVCEEVSLGGAPVSSTRIRECLASGKPEEAAMLLGRAFSVAFPAEKVSVNAENTKFIQRIPDMYAAPGSGVYKVRVGVRENSFGGVCTVFGNIAETVTEKAVPLAENETVRTEFCGNITDQP